MRVDQMRVVISNAYPGHKWQKKVNAMHERQVIAVYHNIMKKRKELLEKLEDNKCQKQENVQMRFW